MSFLATIALLLIFVAIVGLASWIDSTLAPGQQEYENEYAERDVQYLLRIAKSEMNKRKHVGNAALPDPTGIVQQQTDQGVWSLLVGR